MSGDDDFARIAATASDVPDCPGKRLRDVLHMGGVHDLRRETIANDDSNETFACETKPNIRVVRRTAIVAREAATMDPEQYRGREFRVRQVNIQLMHRVRAAGDVK